MKYHRTCKRIIRSMIPLRILRPSSSICTTQGNLSASDYGQCLRTTNLIPAPALAQQSRLPLLLTAASSTMLARTPPSKTAVVTLQQADIALLVRVTCSRGRCLTEIQATRSFPAARPRLSIVLLLHTRSWSRAGAIDCRRSVVLRS